MSKAPCGAAAKRKADGGARRFRFDLSIGLGGTIAVAPALKYALKHQRRLPSSRFDHRSGSTPKQADRVNMVKVVTRCHPSMRKRAPGGLRYG
jgi:hypothetical protein